MDCALHFYVQRAGARGTHEPTKPNRPNDPKESTQNNKVSPLHHILRATRAAPPLCAARALRVRFLHDDRVDTCREGRYLWYVGCSATCAPLRPFDIHCSRNWDLHSGHWPWLRVLLFPVLVLVVVVVEPPTPPLPPSAARWSAIAHAAQHTAWPQSNLTARGAS